MELFELVEPPDVGHKKPDEKCPFCPPEDVPTFTTFPGEKNDPTILGDLLNCPDDLPKKHGGGARPQEHNAGKAKKPKRIWKHPVYGVYSCEAHHLISGRQALMGTGFEKWTLGNNGKCKSDTGYCVNNALNGIWAPSVPNKHRADENRKCEEGPWGGLDYDVKKAMAKAVMEKKKIQFHKGNHHIKDQTDVGDAHVTYDRWLKEKLKTMDERMQLWSQRCFLCEAAAKKKEKPQPSQRVNQALNHLSDAARNEIKGPMKNWRYFISKLALDCHLDIAHPERKVEET